tara:strand:- start:33075 stop:33575 length:501 start_codon:yes stop_codon:yes gene_type:complete
MSRVEETKRYRAKHLDEIQAKDRERYHKNIVAHKAKQAKYREENRVKERDRAAKYREENREEIRRKAKEYRIKHKARIAATDGARKLRDRNKRGHIHLLFKEEIAEIYSSRREGQQVDHIIPVNGKGITGLHVPWNLQILSSEENNRKNNKVDLSKESEDLLKRIR